jgi:hypothetical protein
MGVRGVGCHHTLSGSHGAPGGICDWIASCSVCTNMASVLQHIPDSCDLWWLKVRDERTPLELMFTCVCVHVTSQGALVRTTCLTFWARVCVTFQVDHTSVSLQTWLQFEVLCTVHTLKVTSLQTKDILNKPASFPHGRVKKLKWMRNGSDFRKYHSNMEAHQVCCLQVLSTTVALSRARCSRLIDQLVHLCQHHPCNMVTVCWSHNNWQWFCYSNSHLIQ